MYMCVFLSVAGKNAFSRLVSKGCRWTFTRCAPGEAKEVKLRFLGG